MPIPSKRKDEDSNKFMSRCMGDPEMGKEFPDQKQRTAVCMSKACEDMDYVMSADFQIYFEDYGSEEELTEDNFIIPTEEDYVTADEVYFEESEIEDWDIESKSAYKYEDPKTGEVYTFKRKGIYEKNGRRLVPIRASEYQGKKVKLGKPFRTPNGPKKFSVYVKNDKGNVVKVNFGDPNMKIKKSIPERRRSFRARHNCDNPGPKWKARYWSCRAW